MGMSISTRPETGFRLALSCEGQSRCVKHGVIGFFVRCIIYNGRIPRYFRSEFLSTDLGGCICEAFWWLSGNSSCQTNIGSETDTMKIGFCGRFREL